MPAEFIRSAHQKGEKVVVFAIKDMASEEVVSAADRVYWLRLGEWGKLTLLGIKEGVRYIAFLGKIKKELIS